jgi:hypothetical protein
LKFGYTLPPSHLGCIRRCVAVRSTKHNARVPEKK